MNLAFYLFHPGCPVTQGHLDYLPGTTPPLSFRASATASKTAVLVPSQITTQSTGRWHWFLPLPKVSVGAGFGFPPVAYTNLQCWTAAWGGGSS